MNTPRLLTLTAMVLAAAASRLVPHPPNFAPIGAMALFGGFALAQDRFPALRQPELRSVPAH